MPMMMTVVRRKMAMRGCAGDSGSDEGGSSSCADDNTCDRDIFLDIFVRFS